MIPAPYPENEKERLATLLRFDVLDTEFEESYDELTQLAAAICGVPISLISLVDSDRQWFKSCVGLGARQTPRDYAFCSHAILQEQVLVVEDALQDARFFDNPLVASDPNIRFYAGAPLITSEGDALGTLCVIDRVPREFGPEKQKALKILAKQVINQLELRLTFHRLQKCAKHLCESNGAQDKLNYIIAHDLRTPLHRIVGDSKQVVDELGREEPDLAGARDTATDIHESGLSSLKSVNGLVEWTMSKSKPIDYRPTVLDLDRLIGDVLTFVSVVAQGKSIELSYQQTPGVIVRADRYMIFSVILNLVHHAIKVTPPQGTIEVELSMDETEAELSISDSGAGMSEEGRNSLFSLESAMRAQGSPGDGGSGLELLLCKQFVERNEGTIKVSSDGVKGTTIRCSLPRHIASAPPRKPSPARELESETA